VAVAMRISGLDFRDHAWAIAFCKGTTRIRLPVAANTALASAGAAAPGSPILPGALEVPD